MQEKTNITQKAWGMIANQPVGLFTLTNNKGSVMRVSNYGCIAQSLQIRNKHGVFKDVLLGYNDLQDYIDDPFYMGGVVGRCTNRIAGGPITVGNVPVQLTQNRPGFHHHGGETGFNKKLWEVVDAGRSHMTFYLRSADGEEGYPGNLDVWVNYIFEDDDTWIVEYEAKTDKSTLINLTQHAYFNLEGHQGGSIEHHELSINARQYLPVNLLQMPTGDIKDVRATPFDFSLRKKIGDCLYADNEQLALSRGFDHTWILEKECFGALTHAATLQAPLSGIAVNVFTTEPSIHVYTGNFLEPTDGKDRVVYRSRSGLCLETQHFPDAPNHPAFPSIVLTPGSIFKSKTVFQFFLI